jgi:hypothetical protein
MVFFFNLKDLNRRVARDEANLLMSSINTANEDHEYTVLSYFQRENMMLRQRIEYLENELNSVTPATEPDVQYEYQ